jgi:uncharacterized protein YlxW (UPF0749 family)
MKKIKKGKISISISIGLTAFVLVVIMFTQFKTVEETDITGIETMREAELRTELASWKSKYEEVTEKLEETQSKIDEYTEEINDNNNITSLLEEELDEAKTYAGYTDVTGEGIIVTLKDSSSSQITDSDLLELVNELKAAGAEAISVNGERVVATTDISMIDSKYVYINTGVHKLNKITSPYVVKAIGNQKYLESSISIKYGFLDTMESSGKDVSYVLDDNIVVEKYNGSLDYEIATEIDE